MLSQKTQEKLAQVADLQEIAKVLAVHSRGIDRSDEALLASAYHPDGTVDYGMFEGPAPEFAKVIASTPRSEPVTLHRPCNVWVRLEGAQARSESYVIAYMDVAGDDGRVQSLIGGRYLDRFEKRNDIWKLAHRTYVLDWNTNWPGTGTAVPGLDAPFNRGQRGEGDMGSQMLAAWRKDTEGQNTNGKSGTVTATNDLEQKALGVLARQDIHEQIMAQARATDRADEEALRAVWHPGATVDVGVFVGTADDYCGIILQSTAAMTRMFHSVANEWIEVKGDHAVSESYVIAFTTSDDGEGPTDQVVGGRYIDTFENRDGAWKFTHRTFIMDWTMRQPTSDASDEGMMAMLKTRGGKYPDDPVYKFWNA